MIPHVGHRSIAWLTAMSLSLAASGVRADVIRVPADRPSIQAAIDSARDGDVITVAPGVYEENIRFPGKTIVLTSSSPRDAEVVAGTVISGDGTGPTVTFAEPVGPDTVLRGFTIKSRARPTRDAGDLRVPPARGVADAEGRRSDGPSAQRGPEQKTDGEKAGGGARQILIADASPTIEYCRIVDGDSNFQSAAIVCAGGNALIRECVIVLPSPNEPGRLVASVEGTPTFHQCRVIEGTRDTWTYQVDGTPVAGTETNVDWRPDTTTGIVYGKHRRNVAMNTRSATRKTNAAPRHDSGGVKGNVFGVEVRDGVAIPYLPWVPRGQNVPMVPEVPDPVVVWDAGLGEVVYRGNSVGEAADTASRYIDFADSLLRWPFISEHDGGALRPGGLGFGPPPFFPPPPPPAQVGVWIRVTPFPPVRIDTLGGNTPWGPTAPGGSPASPGP